MKLTDLPEYDQMMNDNPWFEAEPNPLLSPEEHELQIERGPYLADQRCDWLDHKIEDHGYGGPDSGRIDLQCVRCGWSHRVWLY